MCDDFDEWIGIKKIRATTEVSTLKKSGLLIVSLWGRNYFELLELMQKDNKEYDKNK